MINLRNSPFFWCALLLLIGYGLARAFHSLPDQPTLLSFATFAICCSLAAIIKFKPGTQIRSTWAIGLLIVSAGILRVITFTAAIFPEPIIGASIRMHGTIRVSAVLKVKEHSTTLKGQQMGLRPIDPEDNRRFNDCYILVQIRDPGGIRFLPGDSVVVEGWVSALKGPLNPNAFDLRSYYRAMGIRHQITCKGTEISLASYSSNSIARLTAKWQSGLCAIVREHTTPEVAQLTNALVWGDRMSLNEEIRDAFADAGAMHVLSVSGMHMAIIYSLLYLFLGAPGAGSFSRRIIRFLCYAMAIIAYMGLTGGSPAVVRSGLMILLYLFGKAMAWNTPIWNLLGFAAFLMLWINPFVWLNIGFQLSFLAMAGILLYAKPIIRYFSFRNIILHRTWEIIAVSLAAQVFILPVILRQFHQFPITFAASSLVAMPAGYVVIFGSIINISLSFPGIDWLWSWYDVAGHYFIVIMKWMARLNPEMNFSLPAMAGLSISAMSVAFSAALIFRWPAGKKAALALGLLAIMILGCHRTTQWHIRELIIYHQYTGLLADVLFDGQCISFRDSSLTSTGVEFATRGYRCHRDIIHNLAIPKESSYHSDSWQYESGVFYFSNSTVCIWNGMELTRTEDIPFTHLLIDSCPDINALKSFICRQPDILVIFPAHLERFTKNIMIKFLRDNNLRFWDINEKGYFRLPL